MDRDYLDREAQRAADMEKLELQIEMQLKMQELEIWKLELEMNLKAWRA